MKQLQLILVTLILVSTVFCSYSNQKKTRKTGKALNVLLITSDDLGKQLGCYGDKTIATPNIDKLAGNGLLFQNAYVTQASCSSSRSSILTGMYPHTNGQVGLAHRSFQMNKEYSNLPQILKDNGYKTGIIGKLHVRPEEIFPFDFDHKNYKEARDIELVANRAEKFIKSSGEQPFFLYLNYSDPHVPFFREFEGHPLTPVNTEEVKAFNFQGVDDAAQLQRIADFYTCIRRLDEGIGLLMAKLESLNILENTLIIFIGDHGAPFSRGKAACYESSVGIPFFISYRGKIKPGKKSDALISTIDILPTILEAVNIEIPANNQGKSLWPILDSEKNGVREYLFTEYTYHVKNTYCFYPRRAVRDSRHKLILNLPHSAIPNQLVNIDGDSAYFYAQQNKYDNTWVREAFDRLKTPPEIELFDLDTDPFEKNNQANDQAVKEKKEELLYELRKWMKNTNAPYASEAFMLSEIENLKLIKK